MLEETNSSIPNQTKMQIFLRFLKFGFLAWGGPVAQIGMLKKELVEEESPFNHYFHTAPQGNCLFMPVPMGV